LRKAGDAASRAQDALGGVMVKGLSQCMPNSFDAVNNKLHPTILSWINTVQAEHRRASGELRL